MKRLKGVAKPVQDFIVRLEFGVFILVVENLTHYFFSQGGQMVVTFPFFSDMQPTTHTHKKKRVKKKASERENRRTMN